MRSLNASILGTRRIIGSWHAYRNGFSRHTLRPQTLQQVPPMSSESTQTSKPDEAEEILTELIGVAYHKAKVWRTWSIVLKAAIFVYGFIAIFIPNLAVAYSLVMLGIIGLTFWIEIKYSDFKGIAESLKRKHELLEGFDKKPSIGEMTHLKMDIPDTLSEKLSDISRRGITFASRKPKGAKRVLENLCECAFFSHHEAKFCATGLLAIFTVTLIISLMLLYACASLASVSPIAATAAKCISSTLAFLISVGVLRSFFAYNSFSRKAKATDDRATALLAAGDPKECDVHDLLSEYQISRAGAPLIPTWVWRRLSEKLNANYAIRSKSLNK